MSVSVGTVGGKSVPTDNKNASLIISETPITTHKVQVNLQDLTVQDEVTTVIDQKSLVLVLLPSMGYQLPSSVTITMDGNTLDPEIYSYNPANGYVYINSVTGDIVITAKADPIQAATYPVKANLSNLSSSPAIVDATTVKEGEAFSLPYQRIAVTCFRQRLR